MTKKINPALLPEALYTKSQIYIKRGFRAKQYNDLEEYQLWASLALELLGKATLGRLHPSLVADPNSFPSLLAACGKQLSPDIRTIAAKTLFERLNHIIKDFDVKLKTFCEQMAIRRNAELHSGESPFSGMSPDAWEKNFWHIVQILLSNQEKTLEAWLGAEDSKAPIQFINDSKKAIDWAVSARIDSARDNFVKSYPKEKERKQIICDSNKIRLWDYHEKFDSNIENFDSYKCPSCASKGILGGILWSEDILENDHEDSATETTQITYLSEEFFCPTCQLHIFGKQEVESANLPDEFHEMQIREREFEQEYGNE